MTVIDLNCDLGEGAGQNALIMPWISSANIACGGHAGDVATMRATIALARRRGVAVGAHPGFPDRKNFGRLELAASPDQVREWVRNQVQALQTEADALGIRLGHVKPHGALYNLAARDPTVASAVAAAVFECDPKLVLVGLAGSVLLAAGKEAGLTVAGEAFVDRAYHEDGRLVARSDPRALLAGEAAVAQALDLVLAAEVTSVEGVRVPVAAVTLCMHGDGPQAVSIARDVHQTLTARGVAVRAAWR
ncbi:MAG: hypothetical protein RIS54_880 [Verrucomicrobiota bacterium]|jgi:UPF0271 protein